MIRALGLDLGVAECAATVLDVPRIGPARFVWCGPVASDDGSLRSFFECRRVGDRSAEIVCIEWPSLMRPEAVKSVFALAQIAERSRLLAAPTPTVCMTSAEWRSALGVPQNRKRTPGSPTVDARIKSMLAVRLVGLPSRTSSHTRDAAGVALAGALKWAAENRRSA